MKTLARKKQWVFQWALVFLLAVSFFLFLNTRKAALLKRSSRFLEHCLSQGTDFQFRIGRISGNLSGLVRFEDVSVEEPWLEQEPRTLFRAKRIEFRYHFLDFFSKAFHSKIEVDVKDPEVYWRPRVRLGKPRFPFLVWMRQWALSQSRHWKVHVENLLVSMGYEKGIFKGIQLSYEDNAFEFDFPVSHLPFGASEVSSVIHLEGHYEEGTALSGDRLVGKIRTEGSVVNWKPMPVESNFDFVFSDKGFELSSPDFLGGIECLGSVDFTHDYDIDFSLRTEAYPLSNVGPFLKWDERLGTPGTVDFEIFFSGSAWAPQFKGRVRLYKGWVSKRSFKALDIQVEGVYPTLKLENSRVLLEDGSTMRLADKTLEARELFREKTYESLIKEVQQETVVWGNWEFSRPREIQKDSEFLIQRVLGDKTRLTLREQSEPSPVFGSKDTHPVEVGFEYRLRSKNALKFEWREDEEFVGVERKVTF